MKLRKGFKAIALPTISGLSPTDTGAPPGGFILNVRGRDSSGKSDLACRAPGVVGYYSLDAGADRVVGKHRAKGAQILLGSFEYDRPPTFIAHPRGHKDKKERDWWKGKGESVRHDVMEPWLESWREAYDPGSGVRTLVQDTDTETYEMMALAHFGKLQQNEQKEYGALYADFLGPIKKAKLNGKLVILLSQMKEQYAKVMQSDGTTKEERTGRMIRAGCAKIDFLMDGAIEMRHVNEVRKKRGTKMEVVTEEAWEVEIVNCKHDPSNNGIVLDNPSFTEIMALMAPGVDPSLWA